MARIDPRLLDPAHYPLRVEITTRFADVDMQQHINNVAMAEAFEDMRVRFHSHARVYDSFGSMTALVAAHYIDYLAEALYPDPLVMYSGVMAIGRTSWTLASIAAQNGRAKAFSKAVIVAADKGQPAQLPDQARDALSAFCLNME